MIDIHSHILPGIDDGSPNVETSLVLCNGLKQLGFSKLIATPHVISDTHPNTPETVLSALAILQDALKQNGSQIEVVAGAEYMIEDEMLQLVNNKNRLLTLLNDKLLCEFSYAIEPENITNYTFDLQLSGYELVLAHPERYNYWHGDLKQYTRLKDWGFEFQVNALSLTPYYGKSVQKMANELLSKGYIDYIGTDLHHERHLKALTDHFGSNGFEQLIKKYHLKNHLFSE